MSGMNNHLSNASIFHLGLQILDILELVHKSGYVYNDLKPDNILIGYGEKTASDTKGISSCHNIFKNVTINLIDFGLASRWKNGETGEHLKQSNREYFSGNLYFSSVT